MGLLFKKYKWLKYAFGAAVIALGVVIIILACLSIGNIAKVIDIVIASALIIVGLVFVCISLFTETHKMFPLSLIVGSLSTTLGITLLVGKFALGASLPLILLVYLIGIFTLTLGTVCIFKAISMIYYRQKTFYIVLLFILATIGIVGGILSLVFANKLQTPAYIMLGIALVIVGIVGIVFSAVNSKEKE